MTAIKRILCPVDFSEFSLHALDSAVAIARHQHATITALHVVPPAQSSYPAIGPAAYAPYVLTAGDLQAFQKTLERFVAAVDYPVTAVCVEAPVVDEILKRSANLSADLIVMGTHGRTGVNRLVLGSVAERVLAKVTCPVLVIPRRAAHRVDLIVMGAHAGGAGRLGFGSTTHDVLCGAACPVVSVKA
jgi:nucleotide-binding universal stress UspA family protein